MGFVGESINAGVVDQLKTRANILGSDSNRESFLQTQLYSTGYINLISSVNVNKDNDGFTNQVARNNVLSGGMYRWDGSRFVKREGINFTGTDTTSLYTYNETSGVRPTPGITSFSIQSKGTYGSIRDATIGFQVFSLEDLDIIEKLYLRPGFSAIVEWGHTAYVDSRGNVVTGLTSILSKNNKLFSEGSIEDIETELNLLKRKEGVDYNYDSFIGFIKNFSYNYNTQGFYECTVSIISKGELIDSLTANGGGEGYSSTTEETPFKDQSNLLTQFTSVFTRSIFSRFSGGEFTDGKELIVNRSLLNDELTRKVRLYPGERTKTANAETLRSRILDVADYLIDQRQGKDYLGFAKSLEYTEEDRVVSSRFATVYYPLDVVLSLLNYYIFKTVGKTNQPSFFVNQPGIFSSNIYPRYRTFLNHISVDPRVAILPNRPGTECFSDLYPLRGFNERGNIFSRQAPSGLSVNYINSIDYEDIRNIHVSNIYLHNLFSQYTQTTSVEESNFRSMVQQMLDDISKALGGINELDIEYDETSNLYYILDRANIVDFKGLNQDPLVLPVSGLKGLVTDINLETKITKDLANKISIAAQGTNTDFNEYVAQYKKWNQQVTDRFSRGPVFQTATLSSETVTTENERKTNSNELFKKLKKSYFNLRVNGHLYDSDWDGLGSSVSSLFKRLSELDTVRERRPAKGVIPVELSLTLRGISGLKIGQSFKISKNILPSAYENYGFIVTGIENTINNGVWLTTIRALLYVLERPSEDDRKIAQEEFNKLMVCPDSE